MRDKKKTFTKEDAFSTLETINMWIVSCDTKASVFLGFIGVIFTIIFSSDVGTKIINLIKGLFQRKDINVDLIYGIFLFLSVACCFVGLFFLIKTITPQVIYKVKKKNSKEIDFKSLMFFASVSKMYFTDYIKKIEDFQEERIIKDLCFQIHSASIICNKKFRFIKIGILLSFLGLVSFLMAIFIAYIS